MEQSDSKRCEEFARTITAWRLSRGMTQEQLALRAGISKSAISQIERGINGAMPKPITMSKLAHAFGVAIELLLKDPDAELIKKMQDRPCLRVVDQEEAAPVQAGPTHVAIPDGDSQIIRIKRLSCAPAVTSELTLFEARYLTACLAEHDLTQLRTWEIIDDSMAPTLKRRDVALVIPLRDGLFRGNGVYVVRFGNVCEPRRVNASMDGGLRISLDNPLYSETPTSLSADELRAEALIVYGFRGARIQ